MELVDITSPLRSDQLEGTEINMPEEFVWKIPEVRLFKDEPKVVEIPFPKAKVILLKSLGV